MLALEVIEAALDQDHEYKRQHTNDQQYNQKYLIVAIVLTYAK